MRLLTPREFISCVDNMYLQARANVLKDGYAAEALVLLDSRGRRRLVVNIKDGPLSHRPDEVAGLVREHHATAAIHVCEAYLGFLTRTDPEIDAMAPADRPDREEVLITAGIWPLFDIAETRFASIVRSGDTVDLAEVDLAGALEAAGLPPDGKLTAASWLAELLPRH